jgi:hypothetical protein
MPLIKLNNRSIKDVTSLPFGVGTLVHIQSQTASNSASISFTTGINSTYKEYQFYFIDIHPRTDSVLFQFNLSTDSGSNYNVTKTTTAFLAEVSQSGTFSGLSYQTASDLAQSTSDQRITTNIGSASSESAVGYMSLFNPASTVYVKHFISTSQFYYPDPSVDFTTNMFVAGYANTTSAINAIRFQMSSGNFDGTIAMFGVL